MKLGFRDDVMVIDGELNKQMQQKKAALTQVESLKKAKPREFVTVPL